MGNPEKERRGEKGLDRIISTGVVFARPKQIAFLCF